MSLTAVVVPPVHAQLWRPVNLVAEPYRARALAVDPRNDSVIYLDSPGGGIWKTTDGGFYQWLPLLDSSYSVQACSLTIDPNSPDVLYAGTGDDYSPRPSQGVARSNDGGQTWKFGVRFTNRPVCTIAVDPANSTHLFAGSDEGLFFSRNTGDSWQKILSLPITAVAFDGRGNIYAGELGPDKLGTRDNVLARSSDGGQSWTNLSLPMPSGVASGRTVSVSILANGSTVFVVVVANQNADSFDPFQKSTTLPVMDFYRSTDGGGTWTVVTNIEPANPPVKMFTDAAAKTLYVTGKSILASRNQGNTWSAIPSSTSQFHDAVFSGGLLLAAGEQGLEMTVTTPEAQPSGIVFPVLPLGQFLEVAVDTTGNTWAAGPGGLFNPSTVGVGTEGIGSIATPTGTSQNIFAASNTSIYVSTNGGAKFTSSIAIPPSELRAPYPPLALAPNSTTTLFVAGQHLYRTTNSGTNWTALATVDPNPSNVVIALAIAPSNVRTMYAATACLSLASTSCSSSSLVWQSTNSGASWTQKSTVQGFVNRLAVDPRQANTVYAAVGGFPAGSNTSAGYVPGDLLSSSDGGTTFISVRGNLPKVPINSIVIDPTSLPTVVLTPPVIGRPFVPPQLLPAQTLYVGTDAGVFVSFNAGTQWASINSGLPPAQITRLSLQQPTATLEAATFGRGIYRASVTGLSTSLIVSPLAATVSVNQGSSKSSTLSLNNTSAVAQNWQLTSLDSWLTVSPSSGSAPPSGSSSPTFSVSSATLPVGTYLGRLQLTSGLLVQNILVTLQVTTPPASITIVSGNNATGSVGAILSPLVVEVLDASGAPVPGVSVNFAISSGVGSLSPTTGISDAGGRASTTLTLPLNPGTIQVVATAGSLSTTFTATAVLILLPDLNANSVVNGVTFNSNSPPSPGTILSIFGSNLATSSAQATDLPLSTTLQGTSVLVTTPGGDISLPLFFVSPRQINALIPYDFTPGLYSLRVVSGSASSISVPFTVAAYSPGIFTLSSNGQGMGIFLKADGSLVSATNPATAGSTITFFATGLGAVDPPLEAVAAGSSGEPLNRTIQTPLVFFDSRPSTVLFSGLAPGFAGLYQVNVRVPSGVIAASNVSLSISVGGIASQPVTVAVQPASLPAIPESFGPGQSIPISQATTVQPPTWATSTESAPTDPRPPDPMPLPPQAGPLPQLRKAPM